MKAGALIRSARLRAALSNRELARKAGSSPAAIVAYETDRRDPSFDTLNRLLCAAGYEARIQLVDTRKKPSPEVAAARLAAVLDLAAHLPTRPAARRITYPPFGR